MGSIVQLRHFEEPASASVVSIEKYRTRIMGQYDYFSMDERTGQDRKLIPQALPMQR